MDNINTDIQELINDLEKLKRDIKDLKNTIDFLQSQMVEDLFLCGDSFYYRVKEIFDCLLKKYDIEQKNSMEKCFDMFKRAYFDKDE
jgi:polyhydroxyalkanoate synthesis regulator phasin